MKVLVTGATGFIGTRLCRALKAQGHDIRALALHGEDVDHIQEDVREICYGDLRHPETLKGVSDQTDVVFHLAARVMDWGSKAVFYDVILGGTRNLMDECMGKVSRFVFISSIAACGLGRHLKGISESDPIQKSGVPYNDAKLDAEAMVNTASGKQGTMCTIVRPANVIGPGSAWVRDIVERFQGMLVPLIDKGQYSASLIDVGNLVAGIILAGTLDVAEGRTYHLRDDWSVTWKDYLTDISSIIGKKPVGSIPFWLAWANGWFLEKTLTPLGIRPPLTRLAAGVMGRDNDVNTTRAKQELGWQTTISYESSMDAIRAWVLENMV